MCYTDSKNPLRLPWQHHAITDADGNITDTFAYDTYGKLICRTGVSKVIFCYNGRDGVVTDENGLVYMRARYYSPDMRRFINADIVPGKLDDAVTLNRYAYANANPVTFIDPLGLSVWSWAKNKINQAEKWIDNAASDAENFFASDEIKNVVGTVTDAVVTAGAAITGIAVGATTFGLTLASTVFSSAKDGAAIGKMVGGGPGAVIGAAAGAGVGLVKGIAAGAVAGAIAGVATFGAVNNTVNALYYNFISDGESDLNDSSYNIDNTGFKYLNRWERLDYTKKQLVEDNAEGEKELFDFNAWMYYSEYNFHMYAWGLLKGQYAEEPQNLLESFASSASEADVEPNEPFYDYENVTSKAMGILRTAVYMGVGILGL